MGAVKNILIVIIIINERVRTSMTIILQLSRNHLQKNNTDETIDDDKFLLKVGGLSQLSHRGEGEVALHHAQQHHRGLAGRVHATWAGAGQGCHDSI